MTNQLPEAMRLATWFESFYQEASIPAQAAAELRRLHEFEVAAKRCAESDLAYINKLEVLNHELLDGLKVITNYLETVSKNTQDLEVVWSSKKLIAKAEGSSNE